MAVQYPKYPRYPTCVIFGGTGFIGINLANYLLHNQHAQHIVLADVRPPEFSAWPEKAQELCRQGKTSYVAGGAIPRNDAFARREWHHSLT